LSDQFSCPDRNGLTGSACGDGAAHPAESGVSIPLIVRVASLHDVAGFRERLRRLGIKMPCDQDLLSAPESALAQPLVRDGIKLGSRIAIHPMEGWDGTADGNPTEKTIRRWQRFGQSGAKLIWGGEAVAVSQEGRANPNQLVAAEHTKRGLADLRTRLIEEHRQATGSDNALLIGLQLTHSGRY